MNQLEPTFHPYYCDKDADITLVSSDGGYFKVHSIILRLSSEVFAGMLTLPQPSSTAGLANQNAVQLQEEAEIISDLLDSMYPRRPELDIRRKTIAYIIRLSAAADKYDVADVNRNLKKMMMTDTDNFPGLPLERYILASSRGWTNEARSVSQYCPPPNANLYRDSLTSLDTTSLLNFMSLHQYRKDMMLRALSISYQTNQSEEVRHKSLRWECLGPHGSPFHGCRSNNHDKGVWHIFKLNALLELEKYSPIEAKDRFGEDSAFWTRLTPLWDDECGKCETKFFISAMVRKEFARILNILPTMVE